MEAQVVDFVCIPLCLEPHAHSLLCARHVWVRVYLDIDGQ